MKELPKAYEPAQYEDDIYKKWEDSGFFNPDNQPPWVTTLSKKEQEELGYFSMVLPPPNVTGTLHMGHAVMLAVQDVMTRFNRMQGKRTLWIPGTDHAAVATESKVEKMLIDEGMEKPKQTLGKDAFMEKVHAFAAESQETIINQSKKMGASLDWSRLAFTLDEQRNLAVRTVFKKMFDDGLIYRGYRVVNWSVKGQSTCSDDELVHVERPGMLYTFKYSKDFPIPIATTRPETKLGDTAVAVHPDGKWKQYIGQEFTVEDFGQPGHTLNVQVIGDENVDPELGTGALGVTTAHSPIDFDMYMKQKALGNDIGLIQIIGEDGKITANGGAAYVGLTVVEARERVVAWLKKEGLMMQEEETVQNVGTSDRFKDVVEPLPKTQWFINVNKEFTLPHSEINGIAAGERVTLKKLMQQVVKSKQITIVPERFDKTYFHWIDNLRDWCISRQIWYGHQIPVWYKGEEVFCGVDAPEGDGWTQDNDTLDTWFSSGLWTFSTLNWPNEENLLKQFHPTSVLETGYDILFFWVARMILMTTYTLGQIPFETVYLHGLVRDEKGRKMSKSLGNIINPLDMIAKYGTDATRLSLLVGGTPGNDMKLSEEKVAGFRNFTNKLWNISRFMLMNIEEPVKDAARPVAVTLADEWILYKLDDIIDKVSADLEKHAFSSAAEELRDFTWNSLADWYLEIAKHEGGKSDLLNYILNVLLKLWHPYMPFVTEQLWRSVYGEQEMLMVKAWPVSEKSDPKKDVVTVFSGLKQVVIEIRNFKSEQKITKGKDVTVYYANNELLDQNAAWIGPLANIGSFKKKTGAEEGTALSVTGYELVATYTGTIDTAAEKNRIQKEISNIKPYVIAQEKKLGNAGFVDNAPPAVIDQEKQKLADAKDKLEKLEAQLSSL